MTAKHTHIISNLSWATSFPDKEKAAALQDRLSRWSRWRMPRDIQTILDKLCPPDQTLCIDQLQVDLGAVDYSDLEYELSAQFTKLLSEQLTALVSNRQFTSNIVFETGASTAARLRRLEFFLLNGYMPWNHTAGEGSYNTMLRVQLQTDRNDTILLIRRLGRDEEAVRKRIAWQTEEPIMHKLVERLEPLHHKEIISFTNELQVLQRQKNLVTASQPAFKKDVWHWVLNYLLYEKSTLFNKLAFVKSSLQQMAAHYNMRYEELLSITSRAVEQVRKKMQISAGLVHTLALLTSEISQQPVAENISGSTEQHWIRLKELLKDTTARRSNNNPDEFNELFIGLSKTDRARFTGLFDPLLHRDAQWLPVIEDLTPDAKKALFTAVNPVRTESWLQIIHIINTAALSQLPSHNSNKVWLAGVKFLFRNRRSAAGDDEFMHYCINWLAGINRIAPQKIYGKLLLAPVPEQLHTLPALEIYSKLSGHYYYLLQQEGASSISDEINLLLKETARIYNGADGNEQMQRIMQALQQALVTDPDAFLTALLKYDNDANVREAVLHRLSYRELSLLLNKTSHNHLRLVQAFIELLSNAAGENGQQLPPALLFEQIPELAVRLLVTNPGIQAAAYIQQLLNALLRKQDAANAAGFIVLLQNIIDSGKAISPVFGRAITATIKKAAAGVSREFNPAVWLRMIQQRNLPDQYFRWLTSYANTPALHTTIRNYEKEAAKWLQSLIPGGNSLLQEIVKEYTPALSEGGYTAAQIKIRLQELFWTILLRLPPQQRNAAGVKKIIAKAMVYQYPHVFAGRTTGEKKIETAVAATPHAVTTEEELKLTGNELFTALTTAFTTGSKRILYQGRYYTITQLMQAALYEDAQQCTNIIAANSHRPATVHLLQSAMELHEFCWWTAGNTTHAFAFNELRLIYDTVCGLFPGIPQEGITFRCWKIAMEILKGNIRSATTLQNIAGAILRPLLISDIPPATVIAAQLNKPGVHPGSAVHIIIRQLVPGVEPLLKAPSQDLPDEALATAAAKGWIDEVAQHLISNGRLPYWFLPSQSQADGVWYQQLTVHYPVQLLRAIKTNRMDEKQLEQLAAAIPFSLFMEALGQPQRHRQLQLSMLEDLYNTLGYISIRGIRSRDLQAMLYRKIILAFKTNNWNAVSASMIWQELTWELCTKYALNRRELMSDIQRNRHLLPAAMQTAFDLLYEKQVTAGEPHKSETAALVRQPPVKKRKSTKSNFETDGESIPVKNAGLVLLNMYLPILFERLGIMTDRKFNSPDCQSDAVHYLQYLAAEQQDADEEYLVLNKIFCGLPLESPVKKSVEITSETREVTEGLINAVIQYWPVIGETSVSGFRGNWLVREGLVRETDEHWQLTIEKRAYDILLGKSPFSFSVIKYPWMPKPLKVDWPF
jgi:hypothetical protein